MMALHNLENLAYIQTAVNVALKAVTANPLRGRGAPLCVLTISSTLNWKLFITGDKRSTWEFTQESMTVGFLLLF